MTDSPKYQQIVNQLLADIKRGSYAVGATLPTENRLVTAHGVSRHTVRQAMQELKQMGVVEAQQGKGTIVIANGHTAAFVEKIPSLESIVDMGAQLNRKLLQKRLVGADSALAEAFGCDPGREFLEIDFIRSLQQDPVVPTVFLRVWIDPLFRKISDYLEFDSGTTRDAIVDVMKEQFQIETKAIRQTVSACSLNEQAASVLDLPAGTSALKIERKYYRNSVSKPHLRSISICRGDMLKIESYFQSSQ